MHSYVNSKSLSCYTSIHMKPDKVENSSWKSEISVFAFDCFAQVRNFALLIGKYSKQVP